MKASLIHLIVVSIVALITSPTWGQGAAPDRGLTVVLDVARVFKENPQFDASLQAIQQEAERLKGEIEGEQASLQSDAAQVMEQFKPGTPEFQREEARLDQAQASLRTRARQKNSELLNKEAKLYHDTYLEMKRAVSEIAEQHNITLVLRYDSSQIDPSNRPDVIKAVNRGVVFQRDLDITSMVIEKMKASTANVMPNRK